MCWLLDLRVIGAVGNVGNACGIENAAGDLCLWLVVERACCETLFWYFGYVLGAAV